MFCQLPWPAVARAVTAARRRNEVVALDLPDHPCRTLYTEVRAGRERHPAVIAVRQAFKNAIDSINRPEATRTLVDI